MTSVDPVTDAGERLLRHGDYAAVLTPVSAGIRLLQHRGTDLVVPYESGEVRPRYRGAILAPWPNRIVDGSYHFDGQDYRLPLTEPERQHALHGLIGWTRFTAVHEDETSVTWMHQIVAQTGYPWSLELRVTYQLGTDGLTTSVHATNLSDFPAPYGVAPHPYLRIGDTKLDDCRLTAPADQVLQVTPDRLIPQELASVEGTDFDFRSGRTIETTELDHAFTGLAAGSSGDVRVELQAPDGRGVGCSWDSAVLPWVQLHTADSPGAPGHRGGLATEPMTCPPDAFNSGTDLIVLAPGASHTASWSINAW
jgi:aldose 1-epimerase